MSESHGTAVLIACKDGEGTIGNTVRSAVGQADVYVVSDGSTDQTCAVAEAMGAQVLESGTSQGKPAALRALNEHFKLTARYRHIAVLDDDTTIEPCYIAQLEGTMNADWGIAAASGRVDSIWDHTRRWNPLIAMRAFTYWSYQITVKRGQNALRVVNVICGANSLFRADVFARLIRDDVPYAVDDMYWTAEIIRRRLGRVAYVHEARSWTIDPHRFPRLVQANGPAGRGRSSSRFAATASGGRSSAPAAGFRVCASPGSTSPTWRCSSTGFRTCWSR